ncbi:hypothetical protein CQ011_05365 [Arthrobacter sp. MYb213]|nr:hypothetical protein CQ011_05365 [Arthrobacter sp. MYb213]
MRKVGGKNSSKEIFSHYSCFLAEPTALLDSQTHIVDDSKSLKGRKITDYLMMNKLTGNVAIVEIKKPHTQLISASTYRGGVYKIPSEIGGSVVQVLDQARKLIQHEEPTKNE